jgi:hypothetical protein
MRGFWLWLTGLRGDRTQRHDVARHAEAPKPVIEGPLTHVRGEVLQLCTQRLRQLAVCSQRSSLRESGAVSLAAAAMEALVFERHGAVPCDDGPV